VRVWSFVGDNGMGEQKRARRRNKPNGPTKQKHHSIKEGTAISESLSLARQSLIPMAISFARSYGVVILIFPPSH
jgi:hypothetical protein